MGHLSGTDSVGQEGANTAEMTEKHWMIQMIIFLV